ncbi:hypothetical protein EYM_04815 [Ignicoccus islandicus DSM 13165]|uniref:Uncharacterized protein n=1 Tax=Ignicoccus islandicus DSM 13165 TaxID=940295 RepID=A0A0U3FA29_9CREN|nr:hypothetical protein [Ignicoccus islandicus]ALU12521.1 hypothetical protein EYM_04815 [Ignicoccus islandicus DSM 13165]
MDVWKALENANASVQRKINRLERARDNVPLEGARGIAVANILTNMISILEEVNKLIACFQNLKDTSVVKGNKVKLVNNTYWKFYTDGDKLIVTRHDPSITVVIGDENVRISLKSKDEKGASAVFSDGSFSIRKDKLTIEGNYTNYEYLLEKDYYINYALRPISKAIKRRVPHVLTQLKMLGIQCPS